jgi:hypothetical protein
VGVVGERGARADGHGGRVVVQVKTGLGRPGKRRRQSNGLWPASGRGGAGGATGFERDVRVDTCHARCGGGGGGRRPKRTHRKKSRSVMSRGATAESIIESAGRASRSGLGLRADPPYLMSCKHPVGTCARACPLGRSRRTLSRLPDAWAPDPHLSTSSRPPREIAFPSPIYLYMVKSAPFWRNANARSFSHFRLVAPHPFPSSIPCPDRARIASEPRQRTSPAHETRARAERVRRRSPLASRPAGITCAS